MLHTSAIHFWVQQNVPRLSHSQFSSLAVSQAFNSPEYNNAFPLGNHILHVHDENWRSESLGTASDESLGNESLRTASDESWGSESLGTASDESLGNESLLSAVKAGSVFFLGESV